MGISTLSFNQARICENKMLFTLYNKDNTLTQVFDKNGQNLFKRFSYKPAKTHTDCCTIISRKNQYELSDKSIMYEFIERIYDRAGKLLNINKRIEKF